MRLALTLVEIRHLADNLHKQPYKGKAGKESVKLFHRFSRTINSHIYVKIQK